MTGLNSRRASRYATIWQWEIMAPMEEGRSSTGMRGATEASAARRKADTSMIGTAGSMNAKRRHAVSSGLPRET